MDEPIKMTLPGPNGQQIELLYNDGTWEIVSLESSKEIKRL